MNRVPTDLSFAIAGRRIGPTEPPYIIAEMSGNHNQSIDRAFAIIAAAADAGADAVKIQTYTADTMTLAIESGDFVIADPKSLWAGQSLHELYKKAYTPWEWHKPIFDRCKELGIACFSTPFDDSAVDLLESLGAPAYKIASFENTYHPLIQRVARTGKPVIISTGMASLAEIDESITVARAAGCRELVMLKCTSTYPASPRSTNIRTIPAMRQALRCEIGLSDHTMGIGVAVGAVALGATVIEKHFTLSRADGGVDAAFSLEPQELKMLVTETRRAFDALGTVHFGPTEEERPSLAFRRSLYIAKAMRAGDVLTKENLRAVRPGLGLPPKNEPLLLGKRVNRDVAAGTPATWDLIG